MLKLVIDKKPKKPLQYLLLGQPKSLSVPCIHCAEVIFSFSRWMVRASANEFYGFHLSSSLTSVHPVPELIAFLLRLSLMLYSGSGTCILFLLLLQ